MSNSRQHESSESKAKLYWAIGIIAAIIVAALLIWNSGIFTKNATAATVGDQEFSVAEVNYYYQAAANTTIQQAQQYASFGIDMGYDASLPASQQYFDEENGITYADFFLDTALQQLQEVTILCAEAEAAGYTLSEEGQAAFEDNMEYLTMYSVQQMMDEESYLKMLYGRYMTMGLFEEVLTDSILAGEYAQVKAEEFTYSQEELETYYSENAASLDSYDFRYCYINYEVEEKTDADGNVIEATDEEIAAAMDEAGTKADTMIAAVRAGTPFNAAAAQQLNEASAPSYSEDPEYNHKTDVLGSALSSSITTDAAAWLMDDARTAGDITAIEMANTGYCVVQFLSRDKGENSYQTMDYRTILVMAETDTNEDGTAALPTDEQITAAKDTAEAFLETWEAGEAQDFDALSTETYAAELVEDANRDTLSAELTEWLFDTQRQPGDTAVLPYTDATGNVVGYQLVYAEAFGEIRWEYQAANALRSEDYNAWFTEIQTDYPAELTEDGQKIPSL